MFRTADSKGRVALPGFANAMLIIEVVDETEYRVRKAQVIPEKDLQFQEEDYPVELSESDARQLLELFDNPPPANEVARRAGRRFMKDYG
jgi:hypothetical protein